MEARPWLGEFVRQALANALGTLIAALVLFLGAQLFGVIGDVPPKATTFAVITLGGAFLGLALAAAESRGVRRAQRDLDEMTGRWREELEREKRDDARDP